ncbi:unnamed protein product, partial [Polarella glacialis]
ASVPPGSAQSQDAATPPRDRLGESTSGVFEETSLSASLAATRAVMGVGSPYPSLGVDFRLSPTSQAAAARSEDAGEEVPSPGGPGRGSVPEVFHIGVLPPRPQPGQPPAASDEATLGSLSYSGTFTLSGLSSTASR